MSENVTILFDFNNLVFRNFFIKEVGLNSNPDYMLWRYNVYNSIYQSLWNIKNVTEVIIAIDDRNSWRKSYFPRYKESRKKQRDKKIDVDWPKLFEEINKLSSDLKHYMPFKVIKIRSSEADDIIAIISKYSKNKCVIISNDEDYLQLCSGRIKVYNPSKKKYFQNVDTKRFILEKMMTGQSKDDIFNIITPDDWGLTEETKGKRKPGFGKKSFEKVLKSGINKWLDAPYKNKIYGKVDLRKNFKRNKVLMDFDMIPNTLINRILDAYENINFPPPSNIYQFFKIFNMRGFLSDFTVVENKLLKLY